MIDNIIASPIAHSNHSPYILVEDISDHLPVLVKFRNQNKSLKGLKTVKHRKLDALAYDKIKKDISGENWPEIMSHLDANDSFNLFHEKLMSSIDKHAPERTLKIGKKSMIRDPWMTTGILRSLKQQKQMYKEMLLSKTDVSTYRYRSYRNWSSKNN